MADLQSAEGSTPLNPDDEEALIPTHIETQDQLNAWEQVNISEAAAWLHRKGRPENVLTFEFLRELHRRMFDGTWRWAGKFRTGEKNIGVSVEKIQPDLIDLFRDVEYWLANKTYSDDEIAARFHHRLVFIHAFENGNGRHGRLMAELLQDQIGAVRFTWGRTNLAKAGEPRSAYLKSLKAADKGSIDELVKFARA